MKRAWIVYAVDSPYAVCDSAEHAEDVVTALRIKGTRAWVFAHSLPLIESSTDVVVMVSARR